MKVGKKESLKKKKDRGCVKISPGEKQKITNSYWPVCLLFLNSHSTNSHKIWKCGKVEWVVGCTDSYGELTLSTPTSILLLPSPITASRQQACLDQSPANSDSIYYEFKPAGLKPFCFVRTLLHGLLLCMSCDTYTHTHTHGLARLQLLLRFSTSWTVWSWCKNEIDGDEEHTGSEVKHNTLFLFLRNLILISVWPGCMYIINRINASLEGETWKGKRRRRGRTRQNYAKAKTKFF